MNTQLNKILVALVAVSICAVASGCGEMPEDSTDTLILGGGEEVTLNDGQASELTDRTVTHFARGPVLEEDFVDPGTEFDGQNDWEDVDEGQFEKINNDASDIAEVEADHDASRPAGFGDGCASSHEWKSLAWAVCGNYEADLFAFKTSEACGDAQHRMTRFGCEDANAHQDEDPRRMFSSVLLGGDGACKTMDTFVNYASEVCGANTKIIEAKAMSECQVEGESVPHYETVRITCAHLK